MPLILCGNIHCRTTLLQITALERARRIEELQKRLVDAEMVRTQYNRKINILKDQVPTKPCTIIKSL